MNRDEFDPADVITIGGVPATTVGRLADLAAENELSYRRQLRSGGLHDQVPALFVAECESSDCDRPAEYVGTFVNRANPAKIRPDTLYCQRCAYVCHAGGMFVDVTTLFGESACPVQPYLGKHDTAIGWTHAPGTRGKTIVSVTGCDPVSPGCNNCYAALLSSSPRMQRLEKYQGVAVDGKFTGVVKLHPDVLDKALGMRQRCTFFHNSMGDTFHPKVTDRHIAYHLVIAAATPRHNWLNLTKRHARMASLLRSPRFRELVQEVWAERFPGRPFPGWPLPNLAVGVSVEDQTRANWRMPYLEQIAGEVACVFVSAEPLLGPVNLFRWLTGPARAKLWVIAGGESGPNHRPLDLDHVRDLRDQCAYASVPFYFKQVGGRTPTSGGRVLDGVESLQWPAFAYREVA